MKSDVVIVGGGVVGAAAAYYLSGRGKQVLLIDQYEVPNSWAASGDHARVFRLTYGKDTFYTDLAVKALALWKDFEKEAKEQLYQGIGMLDLAAREGVYEEHCFQALKGMGLPVFKWTPAELHERYRIFNPRAVKFAVFHPDGGMLSAQRSVAAFAAQAVRRGVKLVDKCKVTAILRDKSGIQGVRMEGGKVCEGEMFLFAAGPWSKDLLSSYRLPLKVTRQELLYLRPPSNQGRYRPTHCPVFASLSSGFYGFPIHIHGFMKIGDHRKGPPGKPGPGPQEPSPKFENACRAFFKKFMPDLAGFTDIEGKICHYNNTPDDDFILDRLPGCPNAVLATGFSGHGFKFAPLIGKTAAELILNGRTDINLHRFRVDRFKP